MQQITVQAEEPVRLDRYLRRCYKSATQGVIEKALRSGGIKLNGKKSKTNIRVADGDVIDIRFGLFESKGEESDSDFPANVVSLADKLISEYLLFSSDEFIAINKPEGLAVQGGSKISLSVDDALRYINQMQDVQYKLVHRLDKATSGVLLIANGFDNASKLTKAFKDKMIEKLYLAILSGCPSKPEGRVSCMIGKDRSGVFESVKEQSEGGKLAETDYKVLKSNGDVSLVEFRPLTGRMHQLRFHSKFLGCPIVGDVKYGGKKHSRMMLHAQRIVVSKEIFGRRIVVESKSSILDL